MTRLQPAESAARAAAAPGTCEVCGSDSLSPVLDLGAHPLCDDLVPVGDPRQCEEFPIQIDLCTRCVTAHQRHQVPKRTLFPPSYHYRSRFTADVLSGMDALVASVESRLPRGLTGLSVLDVGCNDGSLLDRFAARGARTIGIEPTDASRDAAGREHEVHCRYFDPESARLIRDRHGAPDVVTFTNVFAHIENLPQLVSSLRTLCSDRTLIVIENHYLGAVIDRHQFDTFYHEHPRTYSVRSLEHVARSLSMAVRAVEFPSRYGGNVRVMIGGAAGEPPGRAWAGGHDPEEDFPARMRSMQAIVERWRASTRERIERLASAHGPLPAKAFPGRAAILVKLLGLGAEHLRATYEKPGSPKIGHYIPGTRIPILTDDQFPTAAPVAINLAWHISREIRDYLRSRGYAGEVIDILDPASLGTG